ncbi:SycD/LcrH family type III secretion system chaperone BicA [Burkholderia pseudomallei]|uniref:SycD/LcrH family type III secretion system chaperone BicA n=1 Tax=Burkholderia pseudomallei TaxID=28450 RepID=UPI000A1A1A14|nr:SycD/LcrH family type III secretion system chaperone BicA [Burkholderia pseudomallei]ARL19816.1 CesD/SycD/LcrH family type III secretion system chaperone [Burkholderia pseudomallei]ARL41267.1 CesD/SycD/LcrH family type III secretion system chaperone [Burkholderia pseudomallei]RIV61832.1 type III secretion system translocator chaperone SicA [Burkholderia pseudomallei]RIV67849.1 type III secretion system translocator chaperone SicA [Burkholderia pseudomallei]
MTQRDVNIDDIEAQEMAAALLDAVQNGATLKDLHQVPQDLMDGIYAFAYRFYQQGRLDDAEVFFRFLCIYDFYNAEYAMGLAAVCQLKKEYARAIDLYALAYSLSKDDHRPMFHTGQCHLLMGKAALARRCFGIVAERSLDERLAQKAQSYLDGLDEVGADAARASAGNDH